MRIRPVDDIEQALEAALDPARGEDQELFIEYVLGRIRDEGFVESEEYARALAAETPNAIHGTVANAITQRRSCLG